jgi:DNA replication and repair protein RecF
MGIRYFRAQNFRCLEDAELSPNGRFNLVYGANASGKTSLLEALAYLGRGKSFRGAPPSSLIRHGTSAFVLFGRAAAGEHLASLGVRNSREGLEVKVDGVAGVGASALAEALPLQLIDPDVHSLVGGGPETRRRYLDWVAFHVEQEFLAEWRRFRRALKQRNAALRSGQGLGAWTTEFAELGQKVNQTRVRVLDRLARALEAQSEHLLGHKVRFEYRRGWGADKSLAEALQESGERDAQLGATQAGPHRADIAVVVDERQARRLVSRGQQKLLACSMILAATEVVQREIGRSMLLLLDDPAAELDRHSLGRLMSGVFDLDCQVIATALERDSLQFPEPPSVFHVEHGRLTAE